MMTILGIALAGVLLLMVYRHRDLGASLQSATLLGSVLLLIWLQDGGYFGTRQADVEESAPLAGLSR